MSGTDKKQTFLHGAALLALATAVVKVIGALYKLPLNMAIGAEGFSYFSTAYDIYSLLLMISSAGLPVAMSRMISQYNSLGEYTQVRRVHRVSRAIFLGLGIVSTLIMLLGSHWLAQKMNQPDAWIAIVCLAPCAVLMAVMSAYRGFFQGQGNMRPTSVSQVLEAVVKLVVGLAAAFAIVKFTGNIPLAAGGAILGVTAGSLLSVGYLGVKFRPAYRDLPQTSEQPRSYGSITKSLLAIALPITIGSAGLQLLTVIETGFYMDRLVFLVDSNQYMAHLVQGDAQRTASVLKGVYNMAQTIFNMPCSFMVPIATSVLPAITEFLTLKKNAEVRATEESAARVVGLLALPCCIGLTLLGQPVMALLGGYEGELLAVAGQLLSWLGVSIILYAIVQYTNVLLQSHGYAYIPVVNMLLGGGLKLAVVYVLVGNPAIGILGVPMGAALCYLCIAALNMVSITLRVPQKPAILRNMFRPFLPAAVMGVAVYGAHRGVQLLLGADASSIFLCGVPIAVGVLVYAVAVVLCKTITKEDCQLLPKGDKIAKLLHL